MSKYDRVWEYIVKMGKEDCTVTFAEIESIIGIPIDHSFLNSKKELLAYGYEVKKISLKDKTVRIQKIEK